MQTPEEMLASFILLWAVIDPVGTVPVYISCTRGHDVAEKRKIARTSALVAAGILLFFLVVGEVFLRAMGVPLLAFQIAGGLVLFLFALTMIFGDGKPESESRLARSAQDTAIFPLATPSIASPGAMMAVVLLTENAQHSLPHQAVTAGLMMIVVGAVYLFMRGAGWISRIIGSGGASVISRVMGLILASLAAANVLEGIKVYFG
jgi:multiple antibiotic resistance protein